MGVAALRTRYALVSDRCVPPANACGAGAAVHMLRPQQTTAREHAHLLSYRQFAERVLPSRGLTLAVPTGPAATPMDQRAAVYASNRSRLIAIDGGFGAVLPPQPPPLGDLRVEAARSGYPTLEIGGAWLHSRYDPAREAAKLVEPLAEQPMSAAILYGMGLGYALDAFREAFVDVPLVVVEPDLDLFGVALSLRPLPLRLDGVSFAVGADPAGVAAALSAIPSRQLQVIRPRAFYERHRDFWSVVDAMVAQAASRAEINANTLRRFGVVWVRNLLANLDLVVNAPGATTLPGRFAGLPALVLAAGPSLALVLPQLRRLRRGMLVVAVDTALGPCMRHGVDPDLVVVVDPQYWNSRHLDRLRPTQALLVSETSTCPRVFRHLPMPTVMASSLFPLGRYFEAIVGAKGEVGAGGSVATTAWDVARLAGCSPIVMAGLDLGFPGNRTHCEGTFFEELRLAEGVRSRPAMTAAFDYQYSAEPFRQPANDGGSVMTDRRMQVYRSWFESQAGLYPMTETWNVSGGGLRLDGIPYHAAADALALPDRREEIDATLASLRDEVERHGATHAGPDPSELLDALHSELEELLQVAQRGVALTDRLAQTLSERADPRALIRQLDTIDRQIADSKASAIAGFLMHEVIEETQASGHSRKQGADVVAASHALYRGLVESAELHLRAVARRGKSGSRSGDS